MRRSILAFSLLVAVVGVVAVMGLVGAGGASAVVDLPPSVAADQGSVFAPENTTATNTGSFSDPAGKPVTLTASSGTLQQIGTTSGTWSWSGSGDESTPYQVTVTATNVEGATATTSFSVGFTDVAPSVAADQGSVFAPENTTATNTGTFSDYDDPVTVTLIASSGTISQTGSTSGTWSWSGSGDEVSPLIVRVTAVNSDGAAAYTSFSVGFIDVAPSVAADHAAVNAPENTTATNTGTFSDVDDAVTVTASSGTLQQIGSTSGTWSWSGTVTATPYPVTVSATNSDGANAKTSFTVSPPPCSGLTITNGADGAATGSPNATFAGSFTVTVQNCTGGPLNNLKIQGGTTGWLAETSAATTPNATVTVSTKKKGMPQVITATFANPLANGASATVTVYETGTVPKGTTCGSDLPISGAWSATAKDANKNSVSSGPSSQATIHITC